ECIVDKIHVRLDRAVEGFRAAQAPARYRDLAIVTPAVVFVNRFDTIEILTRLKIKALGPNFIVKRSNEQKIVRRGLHYCQRSCHAVGCAWPVQVAAAERI